MHNNGEQYDFRTEPISLFIPPQLILPHCFAGICFSIYAIHVKGTASSIDVDIKVPIYIQPTGYSEPAPISDPRAKQFEVPLPDIFKGPRGLNALNYLYFTNF